jgi:hypothetical protein
MDPVQVREQEGAVHVVALLQGECVRIEAGGGGVKGGVAVGEPGGMAPENMQALKAARVACAWCCGVLQKRAATALAMPKSSSARTSLSEDRSIAAATNQVGPQACNVRVGVDCCNVVEVGDGFDKLASATSVPTLNPKISKWRLARAWAWRLHVASASRTAVASAAVSSAESRAGSGGVNGLVEIASGVCLCAEGTNSSPGDVA